MKNTGKFIVIDGTDGSGKATQTKLLVERMIKEGYPVETISFPRYGEPSAALVEEYLAGKYGTADQVGAKPASIFYAVDRFTAAQSHIKPWLEADKYVVTDRYVTSNMGHQGGKIHDPAERKEFFTWADDLEHNIFNIPRPDKTIILHVPAEINQQLLQGRDATQDIHQRDLNHLKDAEHTYLEMADMFPNFHLIECVENGEILSIETIHKRVWALIETLLTK